VEIQTTRSEPPPQATKEKTKDIANLAEKNELEVRLNVGCHKRQDRELVYIKLKLLC
jgi:hypothetical protein